MAEVEPAAPVRAAEYLRKSTDLQQYSLDHQANAIRGYAAARNLEIVRTYADPGVSGLTFERREGLKSLINDVRSGAADYAVVLVYDVSRWGRFQDIDASAFYEYLCRQAGITVAYCAERFENDQSPTSSILKTMKRIMAAEYSADLSRRISTGQRHLAQMGFKQGGSAPYGLRRMLLDENGQEIGILKPGERKAIAMHRVRLVPGPEAEQAVVREIFRLYIDERMSIKRIANKLMHRRIAFLPGRKWSDHAVRNILRRDAYCGAFCFNRTQSKLGSPRRQNPPEDWIVVDNAITPVISKQRYLQAQGFRVRKGPELDRDDALRKLCALYEQNGYLSFDLVEATPDLPCAAYYAKTFGGLRNAFAQAGFASDRNLLTFGIHELRRYYREMTLAALKEALQRRGRKVRPLARGRLCVDEDTIFSVFSVACCMHRSGRAYWVIALPHPSATDIGVYARLGPGNQFVQDYVAVRARVAAGRTSRHLTEGAKTPDGFRVFADLEDIDGFVWG